MNEPLLDRMYILGFRINYASDSPEFYTLMVDEDVENPITDDGSILFVGDISKVGLIYFFLDSNRKEKYQLPIEMEEVIDIAGALFRLENEGKDENAIVLDCLNSIFDLLRSVEVILSESRRRHLYDLADYLTFSDDLDKYFTDSIANRSEVIDDLMWCLGMVLSKARILV